MFQRRSNSSKSSSKDGVTSTDEAARSECEKSHEHPNGLEHANGHSHIHSHSHSIFHSHSHDDHGHVHDAEQIVQALEGTGDRGSRITLIGLLVNVVLTSAKGAAGWYMHSASLLADAGHSLSDLLGDFVTLFCWKLSRKPPSERYPFGYAKFETLGTTTVSVLLIGGALGIGFHSYHLLIEALSNTVSTLPPGQLHDLLQQMASVGHHVPTIGHAHAQVDVLDPNAAWFAAVSVLTKEWLYRITKKVADEEHSPVLYANAVHHRSDAYSSVVALFAILGSSIFPAVPLDPIGGLFVSFIIFWQGLALLRGAFAELTDAGIPKTSRDKLLRALDPLLSHGIATKQFHFDDPSKQHLLAIRELRAKRAGSLIIVDLTVDVPSTTTVLATLELESEITQLLKMARKEISEVRVKFHPTDDILS
ncbi:cation efflux protein [Paxillus ammoniavirescens]|nr:cation efflux protein [Paxillus ammoniavirescens]